MAKPSIGAFIDVARLGRADWRSFAAALAKILFYQVLVAAIFAALMTALDMSPRAAVYDATTVALVALAFALGMRGAARSHRRPLVSFISVDLTFRPRRLLAGAALWVLAYLPVHLALLIHDGAADPHAFAALLDGLANASGEAILAAVAAIALIPFQAGFEELVFRGWLTQTLGQLVRRVRVVVLVVAVLFALGHGFDHGWLAFPYYVIDSLALSVLSLRDRRLELAIGAHAANNIYVVLGGFIVGAGSPDAFLVDISSSTDWLDLVGCAATNGLLLWLARRFAAPPGDAVPESAPATADPGAASPVADHRT